MYNFFVKIIALPIVKLQAFCLPIIQIVHETLRDVMEGKGRARSSGGGGGDGKASAHWKMNMYDRSEAMG